MKRQEIIIIDDDQDDCAFFSNALEELNISIPARFFNDGMSAFTYLRSKKIYPFLILCDINMPGINGFEFREMIHKSKDQNLMLCPFVFISTSSTPTMYRFASELNIQGYFQKPATFREFREMVLKIIKYWEMSYQGSEISS